MKTNIFFRTLFLALLVVAGGRFTNCAHAQYQSFFGDSITQYSIVGMGIGFVSDYDPEYLPGYTCLYGMQRNETVFIDSFYYYKFEGDGVVYLREDNSYGRIYRYDPTVGTEYLTCDMSLSVGDTFWVPYDGYGLMDGRKPVPIVADTIMYLNGLKHIQFKTLYEYDSGGGEILPCPTLFCEEIHHLPILFVEGIGPNFSPFGWLDFDGWGQCYGSWFAADSILHCEYGEHDNPLLLCVHKDGELAFMSDERAGCWQSNYASIKKEKEQTFSLYPNPAHNTLNIKFENTALQKGILYITDMVGRVVFSQTIDDSHLRVNIKNLDAGPYIATWLSGGKKQSMKFIKK